MTTWSIFWICFFSTIVLKCLIKRCIKVKYPEIKQETWEKIKEITDSFAEKISVVINTSSSRRAKKAESEG